MQQQVAGYLKNEIAEKENSREESELLTSDGQFPVHRQSRKANVDAVDEGNHHQNEDERDDPSPQFADRPRLNIGWSQCRTGGHAHLGASLTSTQNVARLPYLLVEPRGLLTGDCG